MTESQAGDGPRDLPSPYYNSLLKYQTAAEDSSVDEPDIGTAIPLQVPPMSGISGVAVDDATHQQHPGSLPRYTAGNSTQRLLGRGASFEALPMEGQGRAFPQHTQSVSVHAGYIAGITGTGH